MNSSNDDKVGPKFSLKTVILGQNILVLVDQVFFIISAFAP